MKKIAKLLLMLLFMLLVMQTQAQIKRIGIKSGLNLSKGEFVNGALNCKTSLFPYKNPG
jgi:hypothetical protein